MTAPDPMNKALDMLGVSSDGAVAFGDTLNDITSAKLAGVEAAACLWGTDERAFPEADVILPSVNDLLMYLRPRLPQP